MPVPDRQIYVIFASFIVPMSFPSGCLVPSPTRVSSGMIVSPVMAMSKEDMNIAMKARISAEAKCLPVYLYQLWQLGVQYSSRTFAH